MQLVMCRRQPLSISYYCCEAASFTNADVLLERLQQYLDIHPEIKKELCTGQASSGAYVLGRLENKVDIPLRYSLGAAQILGHAAIFKVGDKSRRTATQDMLAERGALLVNAQGQFTKRAGNCFVPVKYKPLLLAYKLVVGSVAEHVEQLGAGARLHD